MSRLEDATKQNTGAILNICMPYSAQDEMCHAVSQCVSQSIPLTPASVDAHLMIPTDEPVDILVRTSSVHRLSDFLLWQCNDHTQLHFVQQYWPLFGAREFVPILLQYQRKMLWGRRCGMHNDLPSK
ncbi:ditrans,polycis-polyprenyl diphosphate synthase [(2E,6E)-farnesydiphosphate specific] [Malassezia yamatoensis]|uniref:Ditrans,polycis-polyprenyl diphosphate synthase [(2E,6E)-farnesydiphosphate specific] n=1 Tax=Malassezia yamatoensis TaxID=253288 RepID=A0AAJ5YSQ2_9BASI|nr:ditrans,polycis-polyprenyl diphosphate synthase [(2E,6E)-farnesydiphosphate specific] [Malassezia yamatoensis]